ncbi:Fe-S cluster assembly protein SufD [Paenibacillus sp. N1-5-1-14]|uniref:Fe-S cluster assembly protein SufD n=1 Tax=Paenibacillus radicibacter TaxID=2972488 RepID=UPI0021597E86|nr:Fe-S cluster assembly protein SufD [Paenibacillus radicibacter]MCR8643672.1 Fe-S cluster assembly protein SufD [Paenibacillus radicibacter]
MTAQTILPIDRQAVIDLSQSKGEPEWMTTLRVEALELAGTLELPVLEKTRIDRWEIASYGTHKSAAPLASIQELPENLQALVAGDNVLIQRNSTSVFRKVSEELAAQGVIYTSLESALQSHSDLVQKHFMTVVAKGENKLTALHAALWSGGVFLYVPRNVNVQVPLQALFVTDDSEANFVPHVLIVAEENSSVTYVENFESVGNSGNVVQNGVVEVVVKAGANVTVASLHALGEHVTDLTYRRSIIGNDATANFVVGEMNSGNSMSDTTAILKGNGSNSDTKVICVGSDEQKLNVTTRAVHFGKVSNSDMITRAVMRDSATAIINGVTKIEKGATGCNGQQTEKVLMLSPKSRGDANPILLIDEDDVKAGHAASVGQVNPEQVHYLMSRGITKAEAQRLIIYGFLAPIVSEVPIVAIEEQLQRTVERKLGQ